MLTGQQIGPFTVEKEIGAGAMGTVYRARYAKNGQTVAIKIISSGLDTNSTALARFEREIAILKKLDHPNIVKLFGTGRYHKMPFYVMEFVEGESLESLLARRGRFGWEEVVGLGTQICAALQHAHSQGIIHRDLKPANVMLTARGVAKLADFGIAKGTELSQLTATNCTVGTAAYMSPEQCRGDKDLTFKSDLYSLGVMLYELLTGQRPFQAETALDMFLAHTQGKFERPSRHVLEIPIWLDTLVCQMLEKKAEHRPFDASVVAGALERVAEKVAAQRSAGVDAVTATVLERPKSATKTDHIDREAARALKAGRKRAKRASRPLTSRGWFQVVAISALLLAVGGIVYQALQPPSAAKLYGQAQALMSSSNPDDWARAREGPITEYLRYYASTGGEQSDQVRAWADRLDVEQRERQLRNRMRMRMTPDGEGEALAQSAIRSEDAGELTSATEKWQSLATKYRESSDPDLRTWSLLAAKRLADLKTALAHEEQVRLDMNRARYAAEEYKPADLLDRQAGFGMRCEQFGDLARALRAWQGLHEGNLSDESKRGWVIIAAKRIADLKARMHVAADPEQTRLALIRQKLATATDLAGDDPSEARAIASDIVVLYEHGDVPEIRALVEQARKILAATAHPAKEQKPASATKP